MWGFYNARNRIIANNIFELIKDNAISKQYNGNFKSPKHADQSFLAKYVYPLVKSSMIVHDSYLCTSFGGEPFPTKRLGNCFIGSPTGE